MAPSASAPSPAAAPAEPAGDGFATLDGEQWLRIADVDRMPPFLISVVSDADHWLYVSSRGGLTAGRVDPSGALFPYVTDDKLHQCHPHTGPFTVVRVDTPAGPIAWEPLRPEIDDPQIRRHLYKSLAGNQLVFEEVHAGLGLVLRAGWSTSDRFGLIRTCSLENRGSQAVDLQILDGLLDLMPASVPAPLQQGASCLVNAYTRAEVDAQTGLGVVALQALIVDQAMPAESLKATALWSCGLPGAAVLLCTDQVPAFRRGGAVRAEPQLTGRRAAYLIAAPIRLAPGATRRWRIAADVDRDHLQIEALRALLHAGQDLDAAIAEDIRRGTANLRRNVGSADGLQHTADRTASVHHFACALFNNMRGGVFAAGHRVSRDDFARLLQQRNRPLHERWSAALQSLAPETTAADLVAWAQRTGDPDLWRLSLEYLPLYFSRRHGDPSRPWNSFAIRLRNPDGSRALDYQGNWRDIFQNWEALCASHPAFLEGVIAAFVNASTADGFNPYRVSRAGVDWEVPEEGHPWSNIGYWGDHQIVYLNRLLEASAQHHPGRLEELLGERIFCFADVPYRLAPAQAIARDPRSTITFDRAADQRSQQRAAQVGGDGRLLHGADGAPVRATLLEKLLIPVLAKLANLVPEGGIWMNTQRPEWNDANNALVGDGLSVVTACQLRRHLASLAGLIERAGAAPHLSEAVAGWLRETRRVLVERAGLLAGPLGDGERRAVLDELQGAFERYRARVYGVDFGATAAVPAGEIGGLVRIALAWLDHTIAANRRTDGLYHSYNLLALSEAPKAARVAPLYEMLEGQVAALSCGLLTAAQSLELIDALFASALFRADQKTFLLYPERKLPGFFDKNVVPAGEVANNPLLTALAAEGDRSVIARDVQGRYRFAGSFTTLGDVRAALAALAKDPRRAALVAAHGEAVVDCFVRTFDLKSFTGRSGTMYGYEGLGSVYWHMVAKLLLAVQECWRDAVDRGDPAQVQQGLSRAYHRVRAGLGFNKTAREFGAFPTDPYSHTPRHAGAQQPGMTGLVKEQVLARLGELGVRVEAGRIAIRPGLLRASELLPAEATWEWVDAEGRERTRALNKGELGFTLCQTPFVLRLAGERRISVREAGGAERTIDGAQLDAQASEAILSRSGAVAEVIASITPQDLCQE